MSDEPHQQSCSNPGRDDYFTSPCCYTDHPGLAHTITECTGCGRKLRCYVEQQPVAVCDLAGDDVQEEAE